jgi:hypothetical protein
MVRIRSRRGRGQDIRDGAVSTPWRESGRSHRRRPESVLTTVSGTRHLLKDQGRRLVILFPLALLIVDLVSRSSANGHDNPRRWGLQDAGLYLFGFAWSVLTWLWVAPLAARRARRYGLRVPLVLAGGLGLGTVVLATLGFRRYFGESPSWQALRFVLSEPSHCFYLARQSLGAGELAAGGLVLAAIGAGLWKLLGLEFEPAPRGSRSRRALPLLCLGLGYPLGFVPGFQSPVPFEAIGATAISQLSLALATGERHLATPVRTAIAPKVDPEGPNLVLLLHESLSADAVFTGLDYRARLDAAQVAPFTSGLRKRRAEGFFVLPRARSNSTATESSVPSVLSGLDLGGAVDAYGTAQSIWSLGKAAGARTALFSSCGYDWSHFDEFFIDKFLDHAETGREIGPEIVNDTGVDDGLVVARAIEYFRELAVQKRRFVGVVHFNGTHHPGFPGPGVTAAHGERGDVRRYAQAVTYIDRLTQKLVEALLDSQDAARTVLIATADHGEQLTPRRSPDRLENYFESTVRVPVWMYVPPQMLARNPEWANTLDQWHERNAQNMDVLPTVRDVLGLDAKGPLAAPALSGRSWLRAPPDPDTISGQSTCSFRSWGKRGLYAVRGRTKLIAYSENSAPLLFDLDRDPDEQHDLWGDPGARASVQPWMTELVRSGEVRRELCRSLGKTCPFE